MKVAELPHCASPPPFVNEETQAQRGWVTCPGLHRVRPSPGTRTRPSDPKQGPLHNTTLSPCKNPAGSLARKVGLSELALQGHSSQPGLQPGSIYISLTHPSYEFGAFPLLIPLHVDRQTVVGSIYGFSCCITNRHKPSNSKQHGPMVSPFLLVRNPVQASRVLCAGSLQAETLESGQGHHFI